MRNPWPMLGVLLISSLVGVIYMTYFSSKSVMLLAVVLIVVMLAIFWGYAKYSNWLVKKLNTAVLTYQENRDADALQETFKKWRLVSTKYAKDVMHINWTIVLLEKGRFDEAKAELDIIRKRMETSYDWLNYHVLCSDYASKIGDHEMEQEEIRIAEEIKKNIEKNNKNVRERATKAQSKRAFFSWLAFTILLLGGGMFLMVTYTTSVLGSIGVAAFILSWFGIVATIGWAVLWFSRKY